MVPARFPGRTHDRNGAALPRTAFTLAAGLLFGTQLGVLLAVVASTASAVLALWAVRALGWKLSALHHRPAVKAWTISCAGAAGSR